MDKHIHSKHMIQFNSSNILKTIEKAKVSEQLVLFVLDIDHFKKINDELRQLTSSSQILILVHCEDNYLCTILLHIIL